MSRGLGDVYKRQLTFYAITCCTFSCCCTVLIVCAPCVCYFSITMTCCRNLRIGGVITVTAGIVSFPTVCGTSHRLCIVMYEVVTRSLDRLCFYSAASNASILSLPLCCAGWRNSYSAIIPNMYSNIALFCADITLMPMIVFI